MINPKLDDWNKKYPLPFTRLKDGTDKDIEYLDVYSTKKFMIINI